MAVSCCGGRVVAGNSCCRGKVTAGSNCCAGSKVQKKVAK